MCSTRGLHDFDRPQGGLFACSDSAFSSAVPEVHVFQPAFPVQGHAIRPVIGPKDFHKSVGYGGHLSQIAPNQSSLLSGRHTNFVFHKGTSCSRSPHHDPSLATTWVLSELRQEPAPPYQQNSTPWSNHRLEQRPCVFVTRLDSQHKVIGASVVDAEVGPSAYVVPIAWEAHILHRNCAVGSSTCPPSTVVPSSVPEVLPCQLKCQGGSSGCCLTIPPKVGVTGHTERLLLPGTHPSHHHDRRELVWLGCPPAVGGHAGPLVSAGVAARHKLVGAAGGPSSPPSFSCMFSKIKLVKRLN